MANRQNIAAWTAPHNDYPEFVSINREADGRVMLHAREQGHGGAKTVSMELPAEALATLASQILAATPAPQDSVRVGDGMRAALVQLADECDGLEGLGSGVIATRIRAILRTTPAPAAGADGESMEKRLADALDCFWNPAIGAAHDSGSSDVIAVVGAIAQGFGAMAQRLREHALSDGAGQSAGGGE